MKMVRKPVLLIAATVLLLGASQASLEQHPRSRSTWQQTLREELPVLGHRNWILIVDSAYPLQTSPGVETVETNANHAEVVREVLKQVDASTHVRPVVYMDAELPLVPEAAAPGVTRYRDEIATILGKRSVSHVPHEQIIGKIDEAGRTFHVLVLKTTLAVPYTSVFLQLNCKYWSDAAESALRAKSR